MGNAIVNDFILFRFKLHRGSLKNSSILEKTPGKLILLYSSQESNLWQGVQFFIRHRGNINYV